MENSSNLEFTLVFQLFEMLPATLDAKRLPCQDLIDNLRYAVNYLTIDIDLTTDSSGKAVERSV